MTLQTTWERAEAADFPIIWYLCYDSSLAVFKTRKSQRSAKSSDAMMFDDVATANSDDDVIASNERMPYRMRLPYTTVMLERRKANGGALPEWYPIIQDKAA